MLFQEGADDPRAAGVGEGLERTPVAVHDLRLDARVKIFETGDRKLRLGAGASIWIPTGNSFAFAGDDQATGFLYGLGEYDFGKFSVSGMLGPHFRPDRGILGDESALREVGSELRWAAGVFFPLRGGELRLGGTLWGTAGLDPGGSRYTDIEWLGEVRTHLDDEKRVYLSGGGGTRLATGYGAPDLRLRSAAPGWDALLHVGPADAGPNTLSARRKPRRVPPRGQREADSAIGTGTPAVAITPNYLLGSPDQVERTHFQLEVETSLSNHSELSSHVGDRTLQSGMAP
jgi:hypothetical protein